MKMLSKRKSIKRFASVFLTAAMLLSITTTSWFTEDGNHQASAEVIFIEDLFKDDGFVEMLQEQLLEEFGGEFLENIEQARENRDGLIELFADSDFQELAETYYDFLEEVLEEIPIVVCDELIDEVLERNADDPVYPDFVGGVFYNDDGDMVIQIVKDIALENIEQHNLIEEFISKADGILVEYVDFSKNELAATIDALNTLLFSDDRPVAFDNVASFGEDTMNNSVRVYLHIYSAGKINQFKETVLDSEIVVFAKAETPTQYFSAAIPRIVMGVAPPNGIIICSTKVRVSGNGFTSASFGYRARRIGVDGFVIQGHNLSYRQSLVVNGHNYGTITQWRNSGNLDASFVMTNQRVELLTNRTTTVKTSFAQGEVLSKTGMTTGTTSGRVSAVNVTHAIPGGSSVTGTIRTDIYSANHDSGGVVFSATTSGAPSAIAGIVRGGVRGTSMYFVRADVINREFSLTMF